MKPIVKYILRWADDALIMSHRLSEYCSRGPFLEEDLAISNVALDYLGQAESLLKYAAELEGKGRSADDIAYKRAEQEYYNCKLVEYPNTDFAYIMVKQFLYDCYNFETYSALKESKDKTLAALAAKSLKEITYHLKRSSEWMIRLGLGTEESHDKMQTALNHLWKYTGELFEVDDLDKNMEDNNIGICLQNSQSAWNKRVNEVLEIAKLSRPENTHMEFGGRKGHHTEEMGYMLAEMQYLPRAYPKAQW